MGCAGRDLSLQRKSDKYPVCSGDSGGVYKYLAKGTISGGGRGIFVFADTRVTLGSVGTAMC